MPRNNSEAVTKKSVTKPSNSKKNTKSTLASQTIDTGNRDASHKMIATSAYYRAEKRGFKNNGADAVQDWLEAEVEIDNV